MNHAFIRILSAACLACAAGVASADTLYAVTASQLVRFDSSTPGVFTAIGNHGRVGSLVSLTTNQADGQFYSIEYTALGGNTYEQRLIAINPLTGASTVTADLGLSTSVGFYEAVEWVDSLHTMVVSRAPSNDIFNTRYLYSCNPSGTVALLCDTGRDNDVTVYDSIRDTFWGSDPNGVGQFTRINLGNGAISDEGSVLSSLGDMAFSAQDDVFYAQDYVNSALYSKLSTAPHSMTLIGAFAEPIFALTTIPAPGAFTILAAAGLVGARRRRSHLLAGTQSAGR